MLNESVLVLNKSWTAISIANAKRAITMLYQGIAMVVSPEDFSTYDFEDWQELSKAAEEYYISTISFKLRVPEIILLKDFNGYYRKEPKLSRRAIFERDRITCQYCGKRFSKEDLTIDHVIPRSLGGKDTWENLVLACIPCNLRKRDLVPHKAKMPLIKKPFKPKNTFHIALNFKGAIKPAWQKFVDSAYWEVELLD